MDRKNGSGDGTVWGCRKTPFFEQPLDWNHAFNRILTKSRALRAQFFVPCIIPEVHKVNCRIAAKEGGLGHAPGNYEFAVQILFYACCRTKSKNDRLTLSTDWKLRFNRSFFAARRKKAAWRIRRRFSLKEQVKSKERKKKKREQMKYKNQCGCWLLSICCVP